MSSSGINLAIETSSRSGSITVGRGDQILATEPLAQSRRHNVELLSTVDAVFDRLGVNPSELEEIYISVGPGSFTGLRVAIATAKTLALTLGCRLVAVPSLAALSRNVPAEAGQTLAVCASLKREQIYAGLYKASAGEDGQFHWLQAGEAQLHTLESLIESADRPLQILGDPLPPTESVLAGEDGVTVLAASLAVPRSETVWQVGREMAAASAYTDPLALVPLYVRPPEAVALWEKNQARRKATS